MLRFSSSGIDEIFRKKDNFCKKKASLPHPFFLQNWPENLGIFLYGLILDKILCMYGIGCNSGVHSSDTNYPICLSSCNCLCLLSRDIETQQTSRFCCKLLTASKHLFYVQCISIKSKCIAHAMYVKQKARLTRLYSKQGDQSFLI